ncbi:SPOR domain-containing protein [Rivibacter subsaxonicus]|uniref:Sporulation related protein n=1 Tax=Rivibacter subsaxonicus TaxID=457575 RepID=A0A4Q7VVF4_9BURK|nr:SPOR domain-containing protein [Rivibacter subsaxonicus]RZU00610.1 sporulation related protein [Rivibacter subsaxonicus]
MLLRSLFLLLLVANLGFLAWRTGWLEPVTSAVGLPGPGDGREPQRMAQQLQPQAIKLLAAPPSATVVPADSQPAATPDAAASEPLSDAQRAASSATACLEAGPFGSAERAPVETALRGVQPAVRWEWREAVPGWWLAMGPFPDREAMRNRREELLRRGVTPETVSSGPLLLLVLGRYAQRGEADAQLAALNARGVRSARVLAPPGSGEAQYLLRVPAANAEQQEQLQALTREQSSAHRFAACAPGNGG